MTIQEAEKKIESLRKQLRYHSDRYYNKDAPEISDFEYDRLGIPKADRVVYLDVEPEISQRLMLKRYNGDNTKKDIHEKNFRFLLECRKCALYAAEKCGWTVINCCENGDIKAIEKIAEEIETAVSDIIC